MIDTQAAPAAIQPDAQFCAYPNPDAAIKGLLGSHIEALLSSDIVRQVAALSNEELFPLGEKALHDVADDIVVLAEIRNRFFYRKGFSILGYSGWKDFVEKNSRYSIRTIQNRLAAVNGKDVSKINKPESLAARKPAQAMPTEQNTTLDALFANGNQIEQDSAGTGRKTWDDVEVWNWLKAKHPKIYAHYEQEGYPRWIPLPRELRPDGWHAMRPTPSMEIMEQVKATCEYCAFHKSSRSCPVHGWPDIGVPSAFRTFAPSYDTAAKESDTTKLRAMLDGSGLELKTSEHAGKYNLCGLTATQVKKIATVLTEQ